jgi:hypothetical protein
VKVQDLKRVEQLAARHVAAKEAPFSALQFPAVGKSRRFFKMHLEEMQIGCRHF